MHPHDLSCKANVGPLPLAPVRTNCLSQRKVPDLESLSSLFPLCRAQRAYPTPHGVEVEADPKNLPESCRDNDQPERVRARPGPRHLGDHSQSSRHSEDPVGCQQTVGAIPRIVLRRSWEKPLSHPKNDEHYKAYADCVNMRRSHQGVGWDSSDLPIHQEPTSEREP